MTDKDNIRLISSKETDEQDEKDERDRLALKEKNRLVSLGWSNDDALSVVMYLYYSKHRK